MKQNHSGVCPAPICADDLAADWKKHVSWFPGELICGKSPMQKWQRNQRRINKFVVKGTFKHLERFFTADSLGKIGRITSSTKGRDPNKL